MCVHFHLDVLPKENVIINDVYGGEGIENENIKDMVRDNGENIIRDSNVGTDVLYTKIETIEGFQKISV